MAQACNCIGGNPCPCQRNRMLANGWNPPPVDFLMPHIGIYTVPQESFSPLGNWTRPDAFRPDEV